METNNSTTEKVEDVTVSGGNVDSDKTDHETAGLADPEQFRNPDVIVEEYPTGFKLYAILGSLVMSMLLVSLFRFQVGKEQNLITRVLSRPHST